MTDRVEDLDRIRQKPSRLVIGLMSGTSADGTDAALVKITGCGLQTQAQLLSFLTVPYEAQVRERILQIAAGQEISSQELCLMNSLLGELSVRACLDVCEQAGVPPDDIDLVGSHGQTVWHQPRQTEYLGHQIRGTLQIGEDAVIAEALHCPVVGDFRVRDMAAGGLGAPLVPYTEYLLYRDDTRGIAFQNIGGIANVTILPRGCGLDDIIAFDTGPGNMLMDALAEMLTCGRASYDQGGRLAAQGQINPDLLAWMMDDPYLRIMPPKTTGREYYGPDYVKKMLYTMDPARVSAGEALPEKLLLDALATATRFTAESIAYSLRTYAPEMPDQLVVGGGGSRNETLMSQLKELLPDCRVMVNEDIGYDSDAKEAVAFAVLANEALFGLPNNVPSATGAAAPVVMGKISL